MRNVTPVSSWLNRRGLAAALVAPLLAGKDSMPAMRPVAMGSVVGHVVSGILPGAAYVRLAQT